MSRAPVMNVKFQRLYTVITHSNKDITYQLVDQSTALKDLQDNAHFVSEMFSTVTVASKTHFAIS